MNLSEAVHMMPASVQYMKRIPVPLRFLKVMVAIRKPFLPLLNSNPIVLYQRESQFWFIYFSFCTGLLVGFLVVFVVQLPSLQLCSQKNLISRSYWALLLTFRRLFFIIYERLTICN